MSLPGPTLYRVTVVVDLASRADPDLPAAVLDAVPLDQVPAMADPLARQGAVTRSSDGTALDVVLLVEAVTMRDAERRGLAATEEALQAAGLGASSARPGHVRVEDAFDPGSPAAR